MNEALRLFGWQHEQLDSFHQTGVLNGTTNDHTPGNGGQWLGARSGGSLVVDRSRPAQVLQRLTAVSRDGRLSYRLTAV